MDSTAAAQMETQQLTWTWRARRIVIGLDRLGQGPAVLLLPALSSISTRHEMRPLQERLAPRFQTISVDWPGFGDRARPRVDWDSATYSEFLAFLLTSVVPNLHAVVAAGHAGTYALAYAAGHPHSVRQLVLLAPTWRGPLPTMMGGQRPFFSRLRQLVDLPILGPLLYRLNVNRLVIRHMAGGHVYSNPAWLRDSRLREKLVVTRASGARFASVRFIAGYLDPFASRDAFLRVATAVTNPVLVVYGVQTPRKSREEIEALVAVRGIRSVCLPCGKLAIHEEFPDAVGDVVEPFLTEELPGL